MRDFPPPPPSRPDPRLIGHMEKGSSMRVDVVTVLVIAVLVLLVIYLAQRV